MDVPLFAFCQEGIKFIQGAVGGVDLVIVRHVILVVGLAGMDRHQPDAIDAQICQIIQFGDNAVDIADAITIGVAEGVDENFIPGAVVIVGAFSQSGNLRQGLFRLRSSDFLLLLCNTVGCAACQQQAGENQRKEFFHSIRPPIKRTVNRLEHPGRRGRPGCLFVMLLLLPQPSWQR